MSDENALRNHLGTIEEPLRRFCGVLWMVDLRKTADFMFRLRLICLQENSADRLALERE